MGESSTHPRYSGINYRHSRNMYESSHDDTNSLPTLWSSSQYANMLQYVY